MTKGVVGKINVKPYNGVNLTSFALKGQDGWYSLGEHPATFNEGDSIQFTVQTRGKYNYAKDIVPWVDGGAAEGPALPVETDGGGYKGKFKSYSSKGFGGKSTEERDYWTKKDATQEVTQRRIEIQAARNAAIETSKFLWEKDLVAKPKKVADQYDAFLALVDQVASDYIKNTESRLGGKIQSTDDNNIVQEESTGSTSEEGWD